MLGRAKMNTNDGCGQIANTSAVRGEVGGSNNRKQHHGHTNAWPPDAPEVLRKVGSNKEQCSCLRPCGLCVRVWACKDDKSPTTTTLAIPAMWMPPPRGTTILLNTSAPWRSQCTAHAGGAHTNHSRPEQSNSSLGAYAYCLNFLLRAHPRCTKRLRERQARRVRMAVRLMEGFCRAHCTSTGRTDPTRNQLHTLAPATSDRHKAHFRTLRRLNIRRSPPRVAHATTHVGLSH